MRDLTLVGLTEDRSRLLLVSDSGEEFVLPADARLRAALRGDHARLGQLEIQMDSALRPRDIQARIRAGETPEAVAQAAQTTVDRIMRYASPVLAERAHVADRAQRSSVRRKAGEGPARLLEDAVAERLRSRNVDPDTVAWDAWRREDGRWTLVADYRSGESSRHAEFVFDAPGRYVVADDDEARWLVGEQSTRKGPQPRAGGGPRRLSAVSPEDELPLGADAIDLVSDDPPVGVAEADVDERTVDLTEAREAVRSTQDPDAADSGETAEQERPAETGPEQQPAGETDVSDDEVSEPSPEAAQEQVPKKSSRRSRRASVPSWDEIMFGGGKRE